MLAYVLLEEYPLGGRGVTPVQVQIPLRPYCPMCCPLGHDKSKWSDDSGQFTQTGGAATFAGRVARLATGQGLLHPPPVEQLQHQFQQKERLRATPKP